MTVTKGLSWLVVIAAGALHTLGLSPFDIWLAVPVSMALFYGALSHRAELSSFSLGWLYGTGFFVSGCSWVYVSIATYGHAPPLLAGTLTAIFCLGLALLFAAMAVIYRHLIVRQHKLFDALAFCALWVLFEWLRSWLLTGFPWLYSGYAALETPLAGWAPIVGVYGLSAIWALLGVGLYNIAIKQYRLGSGLLGTVLTAALVGYIIQDLDWTQPKGEPLSVAIYQPNTALEDKWNPRFRRKILQQLSDNAARYTGQVDVLLWPEGALPLTRERLTSYITREARRASDSDMALITGVATRADEGYFNSIIALGLGSGEHHKQRLVPFGEFVPLEHLLRGTIDFFDLPMSNFKPGTNPFPHLSVVDQTAAAFICYEVVYPDFVYRGSRDSQWLITISNDSWFGRSIGPLQHLQMARFRALETQRPLLRGTNNGVSAIVDHRGHIQAQTPQFAEAVLTGRIQPRQGATPIMSTGSWPVLLLCGLSLIVFGRRTRTSPEHN